MRPRCPPARSRSPPPRILTTLTTTARSIASTRCGSSSTATRPTPPHGIRADARLISSPGWKTTVGAGIQRPIPAFRLQRHHHRRRLDVDGLLQRPAGRCAVPQIPRRSLRDERQLSPGRDGWNRRQSRNARDWRCIWFTNSKGNPASPRTIRWLPPAAQTPASSTKSKTRIRKPAPTTGTPKTDTAAAPSALPPTAEEPIPNVPRPTQPGVGAITKYLTSLGRPIDPHCEPGHYYLLNNYNPGYYGNGANAYADMQSRRDRLHHSSLAASHHRRQDESNRTFPGPTTAISGTPTSPIPTATT